MKLPIPVVDLFAGPGGLSEGFSAVLDEEGRPTFKVVLSIENDQGAHRTLLLRSFFRQFREAAVPDCYYRYLRGEISRDELFDAHKPQADAARSEAWLATLGKEPAALVRERISNALGDSRVWVLIGGPPCQAYSLVGRSRMRSSDPKEFEADKRHFLYREYLRIIADHRPPVFVMENVKGLLSSSVDGENMFEKIRNDLTNPLRALRRPDPEPSLTYNLYPLIGREANDVAQPKEFVIRSEQYGIPQARHRVIFLGVRKDFYTQEHVGALAMLSKNEHVVKIEDVIGDLPRLRSGVSGGDGRNEWKEALQDGAKSLTQRSKSKKDVTLRRVVKRANSIVRRLHVPRDDRGAPYLEAEVAPLAYEGWYVDARLGGVCNHEARRHMRSDLHRYLFCACYASVAKRSPQLKDLPSWLLPDHRNATDGVEGSMFSDRFRVQVIGAPATTVTSHIAKDGHYFIHYDPTQCRSLSVREAARIQTFPDNYLFEGNRTQQYAQVGNAVPPLLARQIGAGVLRVLVAAEPTSADAQYARNGHTPQSGFLGRQTSIPRSSKA